MKTTSLSKITNTSISHNPSIFKQVIARKGEVPHITQIAQVTMNPGDTVPVHSHPDMYEVFYIEAGKGQVTVNGYTQAIKQGDFLTIEPAESHTFNNSGKTKLIMFYCGIEV